MQALLILTLVLLAPPGPDPGPSALSIHRNMELDDLDREIQRLHDTVLLKRGQLASTQRLAARGLVSRSDLELETSSLRYDEAHEAESIAFRVLKAHERDVLDRTVPDDEAKSFALLLDWLQKQEAIAQVDLDHRAFTLKQTLALLQRNAVSRQEKDDAELALNAAQAALALNRTRQARVRLGLAARQGEAPPDPAALERLQVEYQKDNVRYYEILADGARSRLEIAQERARRGLIPPQEIEIFQKAAADADLALAAERKTPRDPAAP